MAALTDSDARVNADASWRSMFDRNIASALEVAAKMPLVHVSGHYVPFVDVILAPPHELPTSEASAGYCSDYTRSAEDNLGINRSVYFYAGRAHPDFGSIALAFGPACEAAHTGSVTAFDTGGLHGKFIRWNLPDYDATTLRGFMADSVIDLAEWRAHFADYLAIYFDPLSEYWFGRPSRVDPEEIFQAGNEWRAWVFEVRFNEGQRISDALVWCASPEQVSLIFEAIEGLPPAGAVPLGAVTEPLDEFLRNVTPLAPAGTPHYCSEVETWVRASVGV
jgi:hypothetical protein